VYIGLQYVYMYRREENRLHVLFIFTCTCMYCTRTTLYTRVTRVLCVLYVYNGVRCTTTISERVAIQDTHYVYVYTYCTVHVRVDSFEGR